MHRRPLGQEEPEQDPFFETVERGLDFARQRALPLAYVGIAILVLGVLLVWYLSQRSAKRVDAFIQVYAAHRAFEKAAQAAPNERAAELDSVAAQFNQVENRGYQAHARFMAARAAYDKADFAQAARLFAEAADPKHGEVGLYAQLARASALEQQENWQEATRAYDASAFEPYAAVPGYLNAWTEAALGRARVARQMGKPETARAACQLVVERYRTAQQAAIEDREKDLVRTVREFLQGKEAAPADATASLDAVQAELDGWIATTTQKPETERTHLSDALRHRSELEDFRRALVDMKQAGATAVDDSALSAGLRAAGDDFVAPTLDQYQRALLELARLDQMSR